MNTTATAHTGYYARLTDVERLMRGETIEPAAPEAKPVPDPVSRVCSYLQWETETNAYTALTLWYVGGLQTWRRIHDYKIVD